MTARWVPARDVIAEAGQIGEADFAALHPGTAVLSQPYESADGIPSNAGLCWPGDDPRIRFGRAAAWATVLIGHPKVSKEHLSLVVVHAAARRWGIMDHGSTNGTFFRGKRLEPSALTLVSSGEPVDLADAIRLRFYFEPTSLHALLKGAVSPARPVKCRDELPRLASTMRSLGFEAACDEAKGEVHVRCAKEEVFVHASPDGFVVEYHKSGLCLRSEVTTIYGNNAEEKLRDLVLGNLGFGRDTPVDTRTEMEIDENARKGDPQR